VEWVWVALYGAFGALVGGLLNQVIDRAGRRTRIWEPRPSCEHCGALLRIRGMVPIVSYLRLSHRCAVCGGYIPRRVLWVEIGTALLFAALASYRGFGFDLLADSIYTAFFVVIAVIDLEHHLILNRVIYPAVWATLGTGVARVVLGQPRELLYAFWQQSGRSVGLTHVAAGLGSQLAGGLVALAIFMVLYLFSRGSMGDGDVRLAFLGGLIVGYPGALLMVIAAIMLAGLASAGLLIARRATGKTWIPYGPFMVVAAWIVNLAGERWLAGLLS
jgi:leader peptidase (prepilin peptidase)/N-methyltransferase